MEKKPAKDKPFDLKKFIVKELRRAFRRSPMYTAALNKAKHHVPVGFYKNGKEKTLVHYQCVECQRYFLNKAKDNKVAVDHIIPIIDADGFDDWNAYIPSLYCSVDNLQVLCNYPKDKSNPNWIESCHKKKTRLENEARKRKS